MRNEEDVRRFLYGVNLAHLYVVSEDDTRESAEGFRQDLQCLRWERWYSVFTLETNAVMCRKVMYVCV